MDTKALRQKILDLAIRGKLVPQDPNDEPAEVLLERIREQKQQMFKEGKLKKKDIKNDTIIFKGEDNLHYEKFQDGTVKCIEDEIPFEVPEGWAWCKLNDIYNFIDYRGATPTKITNGIPLVTAKNVKSGYIDYTIDDYISEEEFKKKSGEIRNDPEGEVVVIKPTEASTYKNLVDALDEMQITSIGKYAIVEIADGDMYLVENLKTQGNLSAQSK